MNSNLFSGVNTFAGTDEIVLSAQSDAPASTPLALVFVLSGLGLVLTGDTKQP